MGKNAIRYINAKLVFCQCSERDILPAMSHESPRSSELPNPFSEELRPQVEKWAYYLVKEYQTDSAQFDKRWNEIYIPGPHQIRSLLKVEPRMLSVSECEMTIRGTLTYGVAEEFIVRRIRRRIDLLSQPPAIGTPTTRNSPSPKEQKEMDGDVPLTIRERIKASIYVVCIIGTALVGPYLMPQAKPPPAKKGPEIRSAPVTPPQAGDPVTRKDLHEERRQLFGQSPSPENPSQTSTGQSRDQYPENQNRTDLPR